VQEAQNALGNQTRLTSPDTGITNRTFDAAGNVLTETDAAGRTVTRTWDALNRLLTEVHAQTGRPTITLGFSYDQGTNGRGRLTGFTDPSGSTVLEYDARGRLSVRRQTVSGVTTELRFTRDAQGRLFEMRYPSGRQVRYGYDLQGRVNRIDLAGQPILQNIGYHPFGPAVSGTYWNGVAWSRPLDTDGRVQSYRTGNAAIHVLGYDLASRITSITQPAPWANHTFGYDTSDRLTSWTSGTTSYAWTFDLNGNRRSQTVGGNVQASTFVDPPTAGASNRLQAVSNVTPPRAFTFDPSGRTTADGLRTLVHDARGRLSQVTAAGGTTSFTINALGERITKSGPLTPGGTNVFHYDPTGKLIATSVAGQDNWTDILYLGNTPVAMLTGTAATPAISILQADHLDTVVSIMNAAAVQVWRWDRDPYGAFVPNEDPDGDGNLVRFDLRFPGQFLDRETGLHYNYFRDYDPAIGRYVQSDPIGLAGGINTYNYANQTPMSEFDPTGEKSIARAKPGGSARDRRQSERHAPGELPRPPRPQNWNDAAGFFEPPPAEFVCARWHCEQTRRQCSPSDVRAPTDFAPAARLVSDAPHGCRCALPIAAVNWAGKPSPDVLDTADAVRWSVQFWRGR
jgi:RHS repeat-associated protein